MNDELANLAERDRRADSAPTPTPPRLHHHKFAYELEDGTAGTVEVKNASLIAWDETRARRQWPDQQSAPNLWQTFVVWHALTRTGEYKGEFVKFRDDDCANLDMLNSDGESITAKAMGQAIEQNTGEPVAPDPLEAMIGSDPTLPGAGPG